MSSLILPTSLANCLKQIEKGASRTNIGGFGKHTSHHELGSIRVEGEDGIWEQIRFVRRG
jgi:hypothetical protein